MPCNRFFPIVVFFMIQALGCQSMKSQNLSSEMHPIWEKPSEENALSKPGWFQKFKDSLPWNRAKKPISDSTVALIVQYMNQNEMADVHLEFRTETPKEDWQRLKENQQVRPLAKYSLGGIGWVKSYLIRNKFFGINNYDPFTNTLHVNYDNPVGIMRELAEAKLVRQKKFPGLYMVFATLPVTSTISHTEKTNEMIAFAKSKTDWELEKATYRNMYPEMLGGTSFLLKGPALFGFAFLPAYAIPLVKLGGTGVGYAVAEYKIASRQTEIAQNQNSMTKPLVPSMNDSMIKQASFVEK